MSRSFPDVTSHPTAAVGARHGTDLGAFRTSFEAIAAHLRNSQPIDEQSPPHPVPFGELWQRLADAAVEQLTAPDDDDAYTNLIADLTTRLSRVGEAVLWAELNARRSPSDVVVEHLRPGGPRRRIYCDLLEELRHDGLRSLISRYPILRRQLETTVRHWTEASVELLGRVHADRELLRDAFGIPEYAPLIDVRPGLSDPHRGGRTVAALTFRHGADTHTVTYKPKDLRLDQAFQNLLADVPKPTPSDPDLRRVVVLTRDGYGYMEWVPHVLCDGARQLHSFYRNAGRLAAILYVLCATDCHHENFVAHGDQLHLIDGEALFQGTPWDRNTDRRHSSVRSGLYDRMGDSVIRLGLLPQWYFTGEKRIPQDVSALGIAPPTNARSVGVGWLEPGTDGMIAGRVERDSVVPTSLPVGIGSPNRLSEFADDLCNGFVEQLAAIAAEKRRWLDDSGPLAPFTAYHSRFVRRATWTYLWAIKQQSEPEALRSESGQHQVRAKLSRDRLPFVARSADRRVIAAEASQLDDLDVPFFEHPINGTALITPGRTPIADYFETSGYENVQRKLRQLDGKEIDLQLMMIRGVISAKGMHAHRPGDPGRPAFGDGRDDMSTADRRREAIAIGDHLVSTAIGDHTGAVEWLGIEVGEDAERSSYGPLGLSLYAGRTGIAFFLAALAREGAAQAETYERTALGALSDLYRLCDDRATVIDGRGWWREQHLGLVGGGGILLALVHLGTLLPALKHQIDGVTAFLLDALDPDVLSSDQHLDVIFGSAGLIGPLLTIGTPVAVALAEAAGDTLVEAQGDSGGWATRSSGGVALTGFSHGASGMAAALARLHAATGRQRYLDAAAAGLAWERGHFDAEARNWPDLRDGPDAARAGFMLSWCHGAPGIALARLCLTNTALWAPDVETDLRGALESTATTALPEDSLCCGRFGRAAILRLAAREGCGDRWLAAAVRLEAQTFEGKQAKGSYSFRDVAGLFQGSAGIGLALISDHSGFVSTLLSAGLYEATRPPTDTRSGAVPARRN